MNSIWLEKEKNQIKNDLWEENKKTKICIIGGGLFGITCGYYLTKQGMECVLLEKDRIGSKTTGHTTAKITSQHGLLYHYLVDQYGIEFAKKYYHANEEAIGEIERNVKEEKIDCSFERQDNYIYTRNREERKKFEEEMEALEKIEANAELVKKCELPFEIDVAIKMKEQAQFHPIQYLVSLAKKMKENGGKIVENTTCLDVKKEKNGYRIITARGDILADYVILASHYPFINFPGVYFSKLYQSSSYVIGIDPKVPKFAGMYLNVESPTYSFRWTKVGEKPILLIGGADHKTGTEVDENSTYHVLEKEAKKYYPEAEIIYRWSTRDCISLDKIPYIGEFSNLLPNLYVGTGFNKWGMTSSHVAARIVTDKILGKDNVYEEIFRATRLHPIVNKDEVKNMTAQVVKSLVTDKIKKGVLDAKNIAKGKGGIVDYQGKKVGVYRTEKGDLYAVKPICTHLGCELVWNGADKTWDCPCHGSRFNYLGENLYDPAIKPLTRIDIEEE